MTRIGSARVIGAQRLLVPEGEEAWLAFQDGADEVALNIAFERDSDPHAAAAIRVEGKESHVRLVFRNWNHPAGIATTEPVEVGRLREQPVSFMAAVWFVGSTRLLDVQLMMEAAP